MKPTFTVRRLPHGEGLPLPSYATDGAAGIDLFSAATYPSEITFEDGEHVCMPTGYEIAIADGFVGIVHGRSGLAFNRGIYCAHNGVIDSDYRGEIRVLLANHSGAEFTISRGDRIAQLVISPVARCEIVEARELPTTARGANGFGSTGR